MILQVHVTGQLQGQPEKEEVCRLLRSCSQPDLVLIRTSPSGKTLTNVFSFMTLCLLASTSFLKKVSGVQTLFLLARERKEVELSEEKLSLWSCHCCLGREGTPLKCWI